MALTAFEIFGVLKLDKSEFERDLGSAKDSVNGLFNLANAKIAINAVDGFGDSLIGFGRNAVSASSSFESAFTGVRKTVDATESEYAELSDWIMEASTRMASSKTDIAGTMEIAGQLGIRGVEGLEKFTETMIMLGDTTNLNAEEAAGALARFGNIAGLGAEDMDRIGSTIVALGNNFATTESDIVNMSTRLASAGTIAGLSATDILALSTAMSSVGIQAEAGGTAMSQTLAKMSKAVDKGGEDLDKFAAVAGMSAEQFAATWNDKPINAITAFIAGLKNVDEADESVIMTLEDLGMSGIRQTNMLQALALASDMMGESVNMANSAFEENTALTNEASLRYGTMESRMQQTQEAMSNLVMEIGDRLLPYLDKGISFMSKLMEVWDSLSDGTKDAIVTIGLVLAVGAKIFAGVGKFALALNSIISVVGTIAPIITGTVIPAIAGILPTVLPIIGIIAAVIAVGVLLYKNWDTIKEKAGQLKDWVVEKWEGLKEGVSEKWEAVKQGFSSAFDTMMNNPIVQALVEGVSNQFQILKDTLSGIWDGIKEITSNQWELIKNVILGPVLLIIDLVTGDFDKFKSDLENIWNNIKESVSGIWNGIKEIFGSIVSGIVDSVSNRFHTMRDVISNAGDSMHNKISSVWDNIKSATWNFVTAIGTKILEVPDKIRSGMQSAVDFLQNLPSNALTWGRDLLQNFINGISEKFHALRDKLNSAADLVRSILGFSEPEEGPLSNFHTYAPDMMNLFMKGIEDNKNKLFNTVSDAFDFQDAIGNVPVDVASNKGGASNMIGDTSVVLNIYGAQGQDVRELADIISERINAATNRQMVAIGMA